MTTQILKTCSMKATFTLGSGCMNLTFFLVLVALAICLFLALAIYGFVKVKRRRV